MFIANNDRAVRCILECSVVMQSGDAGGDAEW